MNEVMSPEKPFNLLDDTIRFKVTRKTILTIFNVPQIFTMLPFFRNIRKSLIDDNRLWKYSKYAIGEILLVVIGILIALQINNWNESRKLRSSEIQVCKNLRRQLQEDAGIIESNVQFNKTYWDQYKIALGILETEDQSKADTIAKMATNLMEFSDFHQQRNLYTSLVNSGEVQLITNNDIISSLQHLDETYVYINKVEEAHFQIITLIYQDLYKIIVLNPPRPIDPDALFDHPIQNHFILSIDLCKEKDEVYRRALDRIQRIVDMLDSEIEMKSL